MLMCEVLKPVTVGNVQHLPGERVDASGWRWAKQLIQQRKIRPVLAHELSLPEVEAEVAVAAGKPSRGRPKKNQGVN